MRVSTHDYTYVRVRGPTKVTTTVSVASCVLGEVFSDPCATAWSLLRSIFRHPNQLPFLPLESSGSCDRRPFGSGPSLLAAVTGS